MTRAAAFRFAVRQHQTVLGSLVLLMVCLLLQLATLSAPSRGAVPNRLDALLYDWRFQLLPPQRALQLPIVIVDLDEFTQQREGRWPWDRAKVAQLLDALRANGAALIGLDMVFSEPGANPVESVLATPELSHAARAELAVVAEHYDGDATLAQRLSHDVVLGYFLHAEGVRSGELPLPFLELGSDRDLLSLPNMPDYTSNLPVLTESAPNAGFITAIPDADGIVRRAPLVMRQGDGVYASLTLEMARLALGAPWVRLSLAPSAGNSLVTGVHLGKQVWAPLDTDGNMLVPYRGASKSFTYISATRVLRGDALAPELAALDGALVLVGTSALGLADLRTIPLQTAYPGVEVHANVLDTLLQAGLGHDVFYHRPDWEPAATLSMLFVSGLALALLLAGRSPAAMLGISAIWLAMTIGINFVFWHYGRIALPLAMQTLLVLLLAGFNIAMGFLRTSRQKREIQGMFGQYVPPEHVERMLANPELASWQGEHKQMTVLFADIRNFTALSEALSPAELKHLLNRYLTAMTAIIFEARGTIDKYVGDMVMAFWNAPLEDANHATHAVAAALAMQERMKTLMQEFEAEGLPVFAIGIGISTGMMNVGDMGSDYRRAYTVLGDSVNLGARLEGLTGYYQTPILVSPTTRDKAQGFTYRPVDLIRVKGRQEPVLASQPVCASDETDPKTREHIMQFEQALRCYQARDWDDARTVLQVLQQQDPPRRRLYTIYLERMSAQNPNNLPTHWAGVFDHEAK
ncbi:CHASE2 domain-containing protein [Pusillimonas sp. ANT_WB101]|uniref:CHASE2 domain-containing protein n=1 Tax=Pusillimonas sp. ANT_WB101 TaxID=2597356 RepID=UPI0011EF0E26|nr:adenylate/guanylate cyclase domain-containing protein [Pusillimonas sp. ANT_WB101]KAA0910714.1 adenylate/guanylate cyclase domain-containing protein [Pusillimonas sp. ANT_WB101]